MVRRVIALIKPGQRVYDASSREIGRIQAITDLGVEDNIHSDVDTLSFRRAPTVNLGEGYLLWRCAECGELGDVEQIPDLCPFCGAVFSDGGIGFIDHIDDAPTCKERFEAWREQIRGDIGGEGGG